MIAGGLAAAWAYRRWGRSNSSPWASLGREQICDILRYLLGHVLRNHPLNSRPLQLILVTQVLLAVGCGAALSDPGIGIASVSADTFLSSLGVNTHVDQGVPGGSYVLPLRYLGVRNIRDGERNSAQIQLINRETGVRLDLIAEGDLEGTIATGKALAASGALMAFEGPNEPNNFPITYHGQSGGGAGSWTPVARFQEALYRAVKADPDLQKYPVFAVSEAGGETENVGLQFLTIPAGARNEFP